VIDGKESSFSAAEKLYTLYIQHLISNGNI
jgi:hypothetical protein